MGATPIAAHMFIFLFACIGALTPPVAITAYTAAAIAQSDQVGVGGMPQPRTIVISAVNTAAIYTLPPEMLTRV